MRICWAILPFSCALLLSGCLSTEIASNTQMESVQGAALRGIVHGGRQPISGAHVYLLALPNSGYYGGPGIAASSNNASLSLLNSSVLDQNPAGGFDGTNYYVTTDSGGNFTITGDYTCPSADTISYVYAVGGNPGSGPNSAATLLAGVNCGDSSDYVVVNEVSTIASIYAFAGFATDPTHVSSSGSTLAMTALYNASQMIKNLYAKSTGVANTTTTGGNGTVPQAEINMLANILAACVNSTGPGSPACTTLFDNAMNGTTAPSDTATAAVNIAHNPGANVATLFGLQTASPPFQPALSSAPNDFTISIVFTGGGLNVPVSVAIDATGNVWVINQGNNILSKFSSVGTPISSTGYSGNGLSVPCNFAIDASGNVWVANFGTSGSAGSISEFNSSGVAYATSPYTGGGMNGPCGIAIDTSGNVWVASDGGNNGDGSIDEFNSSGTAYAGSPFTGGGIDGPASDLAIDISGNIWAANYSNTLTELNSSGAAHTGSPFSGGGLDGPAGIAIDGGGYIWVPNFDNSSLSLYIPAEGVWYPLTITGGGLSYPENIAVDGGSNCWMPDLGNLSEFGPGAVAISGSNGYQTPVEGANFLPYYVAIDGSGNVWAPDANDSVLVEFVGAAVPLVTPVVANLKAPYGTAAVNRP